MRHDIGKLRGYLHVMSLRLPQTLSSADASRGVSAFEMEVIAEKAASLGRAGKTLGNALDALRSCRNSSQQNDLAQAAADAAHHYFIQRELCGLTDHRAIVEDYAIPRSVIARVGARVRDTP